MQLKTNRNYNNAFTLVELIMVVVLIGVMAVFVIPNYSKGVDKTYEKSAINNLFLIYSAMNMRINGGTLTIDQPAGGIPLATFNTTLNLNIIPNGFDYKLWMQGAGFLACAYKSDGGFNLCIFNGDIKATQPNANPCCDKTVAQTCPTLLKCS